MAKGKNKAHKKWWERNWVATLCLIPYFPQKEKALNKSKLVFVFWDTGENEKGIIKYFKIITL